MERISELALIFLLNALWQVMAVALMAMGGTALLRNAPAYYRHRLWVMALVLSLLLPLASLYRYGSSEPTPVTPMVLQSVQPAQPTQSNIVPVAKTATTTTPKSAERLVDWTDKLPQYHQSIPFIPILAYTLAGLYLLMLLYRTGRLLAAWRKTYQIGRAAYACNIPAPLVAAMARCQDALKLESPLVLYSSKINVPLTVGTFWPVIILPENLLRSTSQEALVSLLGHELAHIKRRDFLFNFVYQLLYMLLSFHPAATLIKRKIDGTREMVCDDMVAESLIDPNAYARSLVDFANTTAALGHASFSIGAMDANILEERVMRLINRSGTTKLRTKLSLSVAALLLCIAGIFTSTFSLTLSQDGAEKFPNTTISKENIKEFNESTKEFYQQEFYQLQELLSLAEKSQPQEKLFADVKPRDDSHQWTALMWAAHNGQLEVIDTVLAAGSAVDEKNRYGYTALMLAAENGQSEVVARLLAAGANPNEKDKFDNTALLAAVWKRHSKIVAQLLAAGADVNAKCEKGETALFAAVRRRNAEMVDRLLAAGADPNVTDLNLAPAHMPFTPLMMAIIFNDMDMARKLVAAGADVNVYESTKYKGLAPFMTRRLRLAGIIK
ncbi:MAG: ankyrin repeat domain-containing protein [Acidobacteriota bacterium]